MIYILLLILIINLLIVLFISLLKRRERYLRGLNKFTDDCKQYEAIVLEQNFIEIEGVMTNAVILQFRDEESSKTVVHRYTLSHKGSYKRGDKVILFYNEANDLSCIYNDNPFSKKAGNFLRFAFIIFSLIVVLSLLMIFMIIHQIILT